MSKNNIIISIMLLAVLIVPSVESASDCPCLRPGSPGTITKFVAKNGTTDNVSFYIEFQNYKTGDIIRMWAAKEIEMNVVPVENLNVGVYFNKKIIYNTTTNEDGLFVFTPKFSGDFEVKGGDASLSLSIAPSESEKSIEKLFDFLTSIFGLPKNVTFWARVSVS